MAGEYLRKNGSGVFHHQSLVPTSIGCQRKIAHLSPPDRGQVGEAAENQKGRVREVSKSPAGDVKRGAETAKKIARIVSSRFSTCATKLRLMNLALKNIFNHPFAEGITPLRKR
jgi:hypothetical protein